MNYTIIRSKRKTMAIHITKDAQVQVRAPLQLSEHEIDNFVQSKEKWITKHLKIREQLLKKRLEFTLNYGDSVLLRGKDYKIKAVEGKYGGFDGESFYLPPNLSNENIKYTVIQIYKLLAKNILTQKVVSFAKVMNVTPTAVKINNAKTRWGSCSSKGSLNFSWRLLMGSDDIIDYVVVHELSHLKEHNHSDKFWAVVENVLPDYKIRQERLKALQGRLISENWE